MSIDVIAWPPVGAVGSEWTEERPVARLRSMLTGRDNMQSSQRLRRLATVEVSALARGRTGAGYCEALKTLLAGGINAVRLQSYPVNWWLDDIDRGAAFNSEVLSWRTGSQPLAWRAGATTNPLVWYSGRIITGGTPTTSSGYNVLPVTGAPASTLVARPGDFIRVYSPTDPAVFEVAKVLRNCNSTSAGAASLRIDRPITITGGRVNLAGQDEGVFRVEGALPRAVQPVRGDWTYTWNFREVFADEVGGFVERDPWT